jgi:hypothetical protein
MRPLDLLNLPTIRRTRRNHAIEHATMQVLAARRPGVPFAGRSDSGGFALFGDVAADEVRAAATEAIARLEGEPELAVHPYCGTNLLVAGLVSGAAAVAVLSTARLDQRARPWSMLPQLLLSGTFAAVASQPLGSWAQRKFTTLPEMDGARVRQVTFRALGRLRWHRVEVVDRSTRPR